MFEKEAENYQQEVIAKKDYPHSISVDWQRGAEFGYNLAKEEIDYLNKHWGNGKDKANEWHDLEKNPNDLPTNNRYVWCDYGEGYGKGYYHKVDGGWWIEGHMFCSAIDAWCELPKRDR